MSYSLPSYNNKPLHNPSTPIYTSEKHYSNEQISNKTTNIPKTTNEEWIHFNPHTLPLIQKMEEIYQRRVLDFKGIFMSFFYEKYLNIISYESLESYSQTYQIDCQMNLARTIKNVLWIKIIKIKSILFRLFKQYERKFIIREQRTYHDNQQLFAFRNCLIEHILFYSQSKLIKKTFFSKWYYAKYLQRYNKKMFQKRMRNHFLNKKAFHSQKKINSIHLMIFYQTIKMINQHYDNVWIAYMPFITQIITTINASTKGAKMRLLYLLKPVWNNNQTNKLKKFFMNQCIISTEIKLSNEKKMNLNREMNKIRIRMLPEQNEETCYYTITNMLPLFTKKSLINQHIAIYFDRWNQTSRILEYDYKNNIQINLTDLVLYSKIFIMFKIIQISLKSSLCHMINSIKDNYMISLPINIYQFENITNWRLNQNLNGIIKIYYFIQYSKYQRHSSIKNFDRYQHWNHRNRLFYKWKRITDQVIPYNYAIGFTLLNEYHSDLCYKYKILFLAMLKSTETKVKMLSKVNILFSTLTDIIQRNHLRWLKYHYWQRMIFLNDQNQRNSNYKIRLFIKKIKVIYTRELMKKIQLEKNSKSNNNISMTNIQQLNGDSFASTNHDSSSHGLSLLRQALKMQQKLTICFRTIQQFSFGSFYEIIKKINHSHFYDLKLKQTIDNRIYQNMATATYSIHNDIQVRAKLLRRIKMMKKIFFIIEKIHARNTIKNTLKYVFMEWKESCSIITTIKLDKNLYFDLTVKLAEDQRKIDIIQDALYQIPARCDQCKKCSAILIGNSMSNISGNLNNNNNNNNNENDDDDNIIGINHLNSQEKKSQEKKIIQRYNDDDEEKENNEENCKKDEDLQKEFFEEEGEFGDFLEKNLNSIVQKLALLKNTQELIVEELKNDIDELYNEIDKLSEQMTQ